MALYDDDGFSSNRVASMDELCRRRPLADFANAQVMSMRCTKSVDKHGICNVQSHG